MKIKGFGGEKVEIVKEKGDGHDHLVLKVNGVQVGYFHILDDRAHFFNEGEKPYEVKSL